MRIGIDASYLTTGQRAGLFIYLWNVLAGLHGLPNRPNVRLFTHQRPAPEALATLRDHCPQFPVTRFRIPGRPYRLRMWLSPLSRLDVFQYFFCTTYPLVPGRLNSFLIPDLTPLHLPECHTRGNRELWGGLYQMVRRHADLVITYSEHGRRDVAAELGIAIERIRAIPLAAEARFRPLPEEEVRRELAPLGLEYGRYILTVGTLEPRKNHKLLFRAYARMSRNRDVPSFPLVVAGAKGWLFDEIFEEAARSGIGDSVRFLGHADKLEYLYNGARVMVYPSLFEGFGLPPLEAMACGTPVVTSNATSLPEVVGGGGLMVDPSDADGLAGALESVLTDERLRAELRKKGLARAKLFSWSRYAQELLAAYRSVRLALTR